MPAPRVRTALVSLALAATSVGLWSGHVAAAPPAAGTDGPGIAWQPCTDFPTDVCGSLDVPLDYAHPGRGTIRLQAEMRPADDPAHRIGTLILDPGGPGVPGTPVPREAASRFDPSVLARFDILGFDPRGTGQSQPLQCFDTDDEAGAVIGPVPDAPLGHDQVEGALAALRTYTDACGRHGGPILHHMSTLDVARDLDRLRAAVGEPRLTYVGFSYGTFIGATYANLFPDRVRAMVLDSPIDAKARSHHELHAKLVRAGAFTDVLDAALQDCEAAGPARCALAGGDRTAAEKFARLVDRLREGPVGTGEDAVTFSSFVMGTQSALQTRAKLAPFLASVESFYESTFGAARRPRSTTPAAATDYGYNVLDAYWGTKCVDAPIPQGQQQYYRIAERFDRRYPTFGSWELFNDVGCATWPGMGQERYAGPWDRPTAAPILVVGQTLDPNTPYSGALRLTSELGNARLITVHGYGHLVQDSQCARAAVAGYLATATLPDQLPDCAQDLPPFP